MKKLFMKRASTGLNYLSLYLIDFENGRGLFIKWDHDTPDKKTISYEPTVYNYKKLLQKNGVILIQNKDDLIIQNKDLVKYILTDLKL